MSKQNTQDKKNLIQVEIADIYSQLSSCFEGDNILSNCRIYDNIVVYIEKKVSGTLTETKELSFGNELGIEFAKSIIATGTISLFYGPNEIETIKKLNLEIGKLRNNTDPNSFIIITINEESVKYELFESETEISRDESKIIFACYLYILRRAIEIFLNYESGKQTSLSERDKKIKNSVYAVLTNKYKIKKIESSKISKSNNREKSSAFIKNLNITNSQKKRISEDSDEETQSVKNDRVLNSNISNQNKKKFLEINDEEETLGLKISSIDSSESPNSNELGLRSPLTLRLNSPPIKSPFVSDRLLPSTPRSSSRQNQEEVIKKFMEFLIPKKTNKQYYGIVYYQKIGNKGVAKIESCTKTDEFIPDDYLECQYHSNDRTFEPIFGEDINSYCGNGKIYGYFDLHSKCYDQCYKKLKIPVNSSEKEILTDSLIKLNESCSEFTTRCDSVKTFLNKLNHDQEEMYLELSHVEKLSLLLNEFIGSKSNLELIRSFLKNDIFKKYKEKNTNEEKYKDQDLIEGKMLSSLMNLNKEVFDKFESKKIAVYFAEVTNRFIQQDLRLERLFELITGKNMYETNSVKELENFEEEEISGLISYMENESELNNAEKIKFTDSLKLTLKELKSYCKLTVEVNEDLKFKQLNVPNIQEFIVSLLSDSNLSEYCSEYVGVEIEEIKTEEYGSRKKFSSVKNVYTDKSGTISDFINAKNNSRFIFEFRRVTCDLEENAREKDKLNTYEDMCFFLGEKFLSDMKYAEMRTVNFEGDLTFLFFVLPFKQCCEIGAYLISQDVEYLNKLMENEISYDNDFILKYDENVKVNALNSLESEDFEDETFEYNFSNEGEEEIYSYRMYSKFKKHIPSIFKDGTELYTLNSKYFPLDANTITLTITMAEKLTKNRAFNRICVGCTEIIDVQNIEEKDVRLTKLALFLSGEYNIFINNSPFQYPKYVIDKNNFLKKRRGNDYSSLNAFEDKVIGLDPETFYGCSKLVEISKKLLELDFMYVSAKKNILRDLKETVSSDLISGISYLDSSLDIRNCSKICIEKAIETIDEKLKVKSTVNKLLRISENFKKRENSSLSDDNFCKFASKMVFFFICDENEVSKKKKFSEDDSENEEEIIDTFKSNCPNSDLPFYTNKQKKFKLINDTKGFNSPVYISKITKNKDVDEFLSLFEKIGHRVCLEDLCGDISKILKFCLSTNVSFSEEYIDSKSDISKFASKNKFEDFEFEEYTEKDEVEISNINQADLYCKLSIYMTIIDKLEALELLDENYFILEKNYFRLLSNSDYKLSKSDKENFDRQFEISKRTTGFSAKDKIPTIIKKIVLKLKTSLEGKNMEILGFNSQSSIFENIKSMFKTLNFKFATIVFNMSIAYKNWIVSEIEMLKLTTWTMKETEKTVFKTLKQNTRKKVSEDIMGDDDEDESKEQIVERYQTGTHQINKDGHVINTILESKVTPIKIKCNSLTDNFYETFEKELINIMSRLENIPTSSVNFLHEGLELASLEERRRIIENIPKKFDPKTIELSKTFCAYFMLNNKPDALRKFYYPMYGSGVSSSVVFNFKKVYDSKNVAIRNSIFDLFEELKTNINNLTKEISKKNALISQKQESIRQTNREMYDSRRYVISSYSLTANLTKLVTEAYKTSRIDDKSFSNKLIEMERLRKMFVDKISVFKLYETLLCTAFNEKVIDLFKIRKKLIRDFREIENLEDVLKDLSTNFNLKVESFSYTRRNASLEQKINYLTYTFLNEEKFSWIDNKDNKGTPEGNKIKIRNSKDYNDKLKILAEFFFIKYNLDYMKKNLEFFDSSSKTSKCSEIDVNFKSYKKLNHKQLNELLNDYDGDSIKYKKLTFETSEKVKREMENILSTINLVLESLSIVDSGPGIHFLIDLTEKVILFSSERERSRRRNIIDEMLVILTKLRTFGVSLNQVLNHRHFGKFVSIINGTMKNFKTEMSNEDIVNCSLTGIKEQSITDLDMFKLISTFDKLSSLELKQNYSDTFYNESEQLLSSFTRSMSKNSLLLISRCLKSVLDEYVIPNRSGGYTILNDEMVLKLRSEKFNIVETKIIDGIEKRIKIAKRYLVTTRGNFLISYVKSLNRIIHEIIKKDDDFNGVILIKEYSKYINRLYESMSLYKDLNAKISSRID